MRRRVSAQPPQQPLHVDPDFNWRLENAFRAALFTFGQVLLLQLRQMHA
jgi:hypothetical protein